MKIKFGFPIIFVCFLTLSVVMLSCGGDNNNSTPFNRSEILIGIAMPETIVQRWNKDGKALEDAAIKLGYKAKLYYADSNQNTQNTQIRDLISSGAKLIIVGNINTDINPVITEAKNKGVIIIAFDRLIQGTGNYDYYITCNNYKVGQIQGQSIIDALELNNVNASSPKNIILFAGGSDDKNSEFFFSGAMDKLNPYINNGKLKVVDNKTKLANVAIPGWWAHDDNEEFMTRINSISSSTWSSIDAILSPNDTCSRYFIDKFYSSSTPPIITGQDAEFASALLIKHDKQHMTVYKNTLNMAEKAITMADQILQGKKINIPSTILATGNLAEMGNTGVRTVKTYLMDPKLIKKDNLSDLIGKGWFTSGEEAQLR